MKQTTRGSISPEAFYDQIGEVGGPDLVQFARWAVDEAAARGIDVFWGESGPLLKFVHKDFAPFPLTLGQLNKAGVLSMRQNSLRRRCRELQIPYEIVLDYLNSVADLIPNACVKTFPLPGGDHIDVVVASQSARLTDWPALEHLVPHKEKWFAALDRAVQRIREELDRRRPSQRKSREDDGNK